ncbi:MAG: 4Fe-4S dicluster domain-containing protein [Pseudomonadota bacterium]
MRSLPVTELDRLFKALATDGFDVIGPTVRDGGIVVDRLAAPDVLPWGWTAHHEPGRFDLQRAGRTAFAVVHGADGWKRWLYPPRQRLWTAEINGDAAPTINGEPAPLAPMAFVGVRGCDLAAIAKFDRVMMGAVEPDPIYVTRRRGLFVVAVDCAQPASTCFCASFATGPSVIEGFDLRLTEIDDERGHRFLVAAAGDRARAIVDALDLKPADDVDADARATQGRRAEAAMGRGLSTEGLPERLRAARESKHFDAVAERCLACANCTMVCPTCFCTTVHDQTDLAGHRVERHRQWDSCFTLGFSYVHGGPVREGESARYRQWLLHKLQTWHDQFGGSGCVGCGRCITWCPAGIDIVAEAEALCAEGRT